MKIDAFCHVMPRAYAERVMGVSDAPAAVNLINRISGIPAMVDLDVRFAQMDEFGDYVQVISLPAPPPEGYLLSTMATLAAARSLETGLPETVVEQAVAEPAVEAATR